MKNRQADFTVLAPGAAIPGGVYVVQPFGGQAIGEKVDIYHLTKKHQRKLRRVPRWTVFSLIGLFTFIGLTFTGVFVAMQFGLLNVRGNSRDRNSFYETLPKSEVLSASIPQQANSEGCLEQRPDGDIVPKCAWNKSEEWGTIRAGFTKDKDLILDVAEKTGVPARMIVATLGPEQLRFFSSERESYKRYFEPLKILGNMTQFSYGVAGFKMETAKLVEQYTVDHNSPFYAGDGMAELLDFPEGVNKDSERLSRISSYDNHYYSFLYAALFIKEITAHWASEGYDVSERPDVVATLFNIGFKYSHPKPNPDVGGANVILSGESYTYGELGTVFYRSDELTAIFPRP